MKSTLMVSEVFKGKLNVEEIINNFFLTPKIIANIDYKNYLGVDWAVLFLKKRKELVYLLGVWLGDGSKTIPGFEISIAFINKNFQNNLNSFIKKIFPISNFRYTGGKTQTCYFSNIFILQQFFQYLLQNQLVYNYIEEYGESFLAGFLDTDGSVYFGSQGKKHTSYVWKVEFYNYDLYKINLITQLLDKLNIPFYLYNQKNYNNKQGKHIENSFTIKCNGLYGYVLGKSIFPYMKNGMKKEKLIKLFQWLDNRLKEYKLPIQEVFSSINGEGISIGHPQLFIRVFGCNAGCSVCDTKYSAPLIKNKQNVLYPHHAGRYKLLSLKSLSKLIKESSLDEVCLTGGEITLYPDKIATLIAYIRGLGKKVVIQTNGIHYDPVIYGLSNVIALDLKTPTMCSTYPILKVYNNIKFLKAKDEIKTLISNNKDWHFALKINEKVKEIGCTHVLQPLDLTNCIDKEDREKKYFDKVKWLIEKVVNSNLFNPRVSIQLHKLIWGFDRRGV